MQLPNQAKPVLRGLAGKQFQPNMTLSAPNEMGVIQMPEKLMMGCGPCIRGKQSCYNPATGDWDSLIDC
jgi:hypothetical protein